jgi:hypothetical protein
LEDEVLEMFRELSEKAQLMIRDYIRMVLEQQQALTGKEAPPEKGEREAG